jgi:hypothetical protein
MEMKGWIFVRTAGTFFEVVALPFVKSQNGPCKIGGGERSDSGGCEGEA